MAGKNITFKDVEKVHTKFNELSQQHWEENVFLTWRWWSLLAFLIVPWVIWWKLVERNRKQELLVYGFSVSLLAFTLDSIGSNLDLWEYPYTLFHGLPLLFALNISFLPVSLMLIYYYFTSFKRFLIANVIAAFVFALGGQQIFEWMGFYNLHNWRHIYSVPVYMVMTLSAYGIVKATRPGRNKL
ncbi:MAG TPA: CBO0543 family protein [Bacilli bacterium]